MTIITLTHNYQRMYQRLITEDIFDINLQDNHRQYIFFLELLSNNVM